MPLYPLELPSKRRSKPSPARSTAPTGVSYSAEAEAKIENFTKLGYDNCPSAWPRPSTSSRHDPSPKGAPKGFIFPITDIRLAAGAGFLYPLSGTITTMPGLPSKPGYLGMDIDVETGRVYGLS